VKPELLAQVRTIYGALSRHDLDALRTLSVHPGFTWQSAADEPETGVREGRDKALAFSGELLETFDRMEIEIEDEIPVGEDAAIVVVNMRVRGAASGASTERREAHLWTVRDGRLAALREFPTVDEAMAAAR
jgi:ketosteroid isomerase-like protein